MYASRASTVAESAGFGMIAASARRAHGLVLGGDEGEALVAGANAAMRAEGVRSPEAVMRMYLPSTTSWLGRR